MAVTTIRAGQNTYASNVTGGTRDPASVDIDIAPFMDAIEERDTHFLNSLSKGGTVNQLKHQWGMHGVNPRGSEIASVTTDGATDEVLNVPTGHGVRFQQGHVLMVTSAATGASELVWVYDDPNQTAIPVKREQGGTDAVTFTVGDTVSIVGIAMPQSSDFPLAPVSRGRRWWNFCQEFSKHIEMSNQNRYTPDEENPSGDWLTEDMLQLSKDIKLDLNNALLFSYRQAGTPDPTSITPAMMGGLKQFSEMSGNVYNLSAGLLSVEALDTAFVDLHTTVGRNAGKLLLMNLNTKQILNRILNPLKFETGVGVKKNSADLTWDSVTLETGTYQFNWQLGIPDGTIFIYDNKNLSYSNYVNHDWKEKEVPTKGNYTWKGISGVFTMEAKGLPGMAVVKGFDTDLANYPTFGSAA